MKNSNEMCQPLFLPFDCYELSVREGTAASGPLTHYYAEFLLIRKGAAGLSLDGKEIILRAGEAAIICPGVPHCPFALEAEEARVMLLRLDPDRMPPFPDYSPSLSAILAEARKQKLPMVLSAEDMEKLELRGIVAGCAGEANERPFGYDLDVTLRLGEACLRVVRFWMEKGLVLPRPEEEQLSIYSLTGYIQCHLRNGLRVEDLAEKCGISYPWFAKKFRDVYGVSCKEYIERIRVSRVEQFLRFSSLDLAQISEATGYADCSHMIKNFKRIMNITPGQFRQQEQRQESPRN
ncbi:MAG: helix-turn-helix domain-containing protein [Clostridia bacterium]|nr:helix-turn-helix domain-containing protein [Clostridia bacterium]